jgi:ribosomal protein L37E
MPNSKIDTDGQYASPEEGTVSMGKRTEPIIYEVIYRCNICGKEAIRHDLAKSDPFKCGCGNILFSCRLGYTN